MKITNLDSALSFAIFSFFETDEFNSKEFYPKETLEEWIKIILLETEWIKENYINSKLECQELIENEFIDEEKYIISKKKHTFKIKRYSFKYNPIYSICQYCNEIEFLLKKNGSKSKPMEKHEKKCKKKYHLNK